MELAKDCCAKALALAPNNAMANHVAGSIYERYDKDVERAKRHYQMAGEQGAYGAYMDLFRLKYNEVNHSYISEYHYGNITSVEMSTEHNMSGAFVLILCLVLNS
jgi:tetratricopeptide (TPR) repeat protein